jgi:UDP-galactopyranose mutase
VVTQEFPFSPDSPDEFEYPVPAKVNSPLYERYRAQAKAVPKLVVCGRLGEYRYLDMDQAIDSAMRIAGNLCQNS